MTVSIIDSQFTKNLLETSKNTMVDHNFSKVSLSMIRKNLTHELNLPSNEYSPLNVGNLPNRKVDYLNLLEILNSQTKIKIAN